METIEIERQKKEIIKKLLISEEDTLEKFGTLVDKANNFFKIDKNSGAITFSKEHNFTNAEKITICLIGKYFAHTILKIPNTDGLDISQLSNELPVPSTTLSKPLGNLIKEKKITNVGGKYRIIYYEIENILNDLNSKYNTKEV